MKLSQYQPQLTAEFVANALQIRTTHLPEIEFSSVTTDSRKVAPGSLFVALSGEKWDGNDFIETAIQAGAKGVIYRRGASVSAREKVAFFPVDDTIQAYRRLAACWRREFSIPVVVVAGSAGKTTTKELLSAILGGKWNAVLKTQGSQNGFVGIPMTLLELRSKNQAAVIEIGIDEIGAMAQHMNLIAPTAAVLTAIGPEHLEKLRDVPTVAQEEGIALSHVAKNKGLVAIALDDPWIKPHEAILKDGKKISFTLGAHSREIQHSTEAPPSETLLGQLSSDLRSLTFEGAGLKKTTVALPLLGRHNASNLLAALAIAAGLGLTTEEIKKGLAQFKGAEGRSEIQELPGPSTVICDYYNAQPASVQAGIELLNDLSKASRGSPSKAPTHVSAARWVCLGDMLELGENEEAFHRELAPQLIRLKIENVLLSGPRMRFLLDELKKLNFLGHAEHFESQLDLGQALIQRAKPGDTLLIKGSRGMKMEEVWKVLQAYATSHWTNSHESKDSSTHRKID
jgi:UDP-N-acetylmuramoyl-tripeptide--D-alanyl-D-alanine ligase